MGICCTPSADSVLTSGDAKLFTVSVIDSNKKQDVNISTALEITYSLFRTKDDGIALITKSLTGGGIVILPVDSDNPNNSKYQITIDDADTAPLDGNYYHESKLTDASNRTTTVFCSDNVEFC